MKKIVIILYTICAVFVTTTAFANGGFSLGVFSAYTTDEGYIEDAVYDAETETYTYVNPKEDSIIIPGIGIFARYDFKNNLFLRSGLEAYRMVSGGEPSGSNNTGTMTLEYKIDYFAAAIPLFLGIKVTPDKGKTNIYGTFGLVFAVIDINWEYHYKDTTMATYTDKEWQKKDMAIGFGGLMGIEKAITKSLYLFIEDAFYRCDHTNDVKVEINNTGIKTTEHYMNRFNLPRQQLRLGLRYDF